MKKNIRKALLLSILFYANIGLSEYVFLPDPIDVVIPCHEKDSNKLNAVIHGARNNIKNVRRIIIVSQKKLTNQAEWFDEAQFPFSKLDLAIEIFKGNIQNARNFTNCRNSRVGWVFQQMIKLYSPIVIPHISRNVLVLDADTVFLKPIEFIHPETYGGYLTAAYEYHFPYFEHGARLIPGFKKINRFSGVAHHMLFQKPVLLDLFKTIENIHQVDAWKAMCRCIDLQYIQGSGISEYELYFNFVLPRSQKVTIRKLNWKNMEWSQFINLNEVQYNRMCNEFNYVSCHTYIN